MFAVLKYIYSEKGTKFCKIPTVDLSYVVTVKSTVEIPQSFVAFSEYMNFNPKNCIAVDFWLKSEDWFDKVGQGTAKLTTYCVKTCIAM